MIQPASLADLPAFRCGHAHNHTTATGCTVFVAPAGATCAVDVRGGGPATRETDLLRPENMIEAVHAVVLSGGSAFGLAASTGVMDELSARGIGFELGEVHVPIVVGACLFDLLVGESTYPDAHMGASACSAAFEQAPEDEPSEGNVGAGCGATVGKLLGGERAMKGGFGTYGLRCGELVVYAAVAVNALGAISDKQGRWIAGCRNSEGRVMEPQMAFEQMIAQSCGSSESSATSASPGNAEGLCTNTTISVVLTNAKLTKGQATKVASTVHDAYARAIKPVHTSNDGDTVFTFASGEVEATPDIVAILATEAMQEAIVRGITQAESAYGLPAARDLDPQE